MTRRTSSARTTDHQTKLNALLDILLLTDSDLFAHWVSKNLTLSAIADSGYTHKRPVWTGLSARIPWRKRARTLFGADMVMDSGV